MQTIPRMMNGILSSCPMSRGIEASKASCISFVYSMKKRAVNM